jgi:rubrerythrin
VAAGGGWPTAKGSNMELTNFGSIMSFAAELEGADRAFYEAAAASPACGACKDVMEAFARNEEKNEKNMLRARREHVTEMVLEPITDFNGEPFISDREITPQMSLEQIMARALALEEKAQNFYSQAAEKTKGLAEISRVLSKTGKKRAAHKARLEEIFKLG